MKRLTLKERIVIGVIDSLPGKKIDITELSDRYYNTFKLKRPKHWRMTMYSTLRSLQRKGAPIKKVSGLGRGAKSEWVK